MIGVVVVVRGCRGYKCCRVIAVAILLVAPLCFLLFILLGASWSVVVIVPPLLWDASQAKLKACSGTTCSGDCDFQNPQHVS